MQPNEYQQLAQRTECNGYCQTNPIGDVTNILSRNVLQKEMRLMHVVIGLSGEVGEIATAVQRAVYYKKGEIDAINLKEEIGDIMWYVALMCNTMGFSLEDVMQSNIRKLQARYPDKYSDHLADEPNRNREAEREAVITQSLEDNPGVAVNRDSGPVVTNIEGWKPPTPLESTYRYDKFVGKRVSYKGSTYRVIGTDYRPKYKLTGQYLVLVSETNPGNSVEWASEDQVKLLES